MAAQSTFFVRSGSNTAYVSPYNYWYTGADNDIDKIFALGQSMDKNGIYIGWSSEFNYNSPELLEISKRIPFPNNIAVHESNDHAYMITQDDLDVINYILSTKSYEFSPVEFSKYVDILNRVNKAKNRVNFVLVNIDDENKKNIISRLSKTPLYKISQNNAIKATLNFIASGMLNSSLSIRNAVHTESPIEMDEPQEAKGKSDKGKEADKATPHDPSMIATFKETNMVGRDVIGIAATGIKVYSALCIRYSQLKDGDFKNAPFLRKIMKYLPDGTKEEQVITSIGGLNWDKAHETLDKYLDVVAEEYDKSGDILTPETREKIINEMNLGKDNSLILSALLSASTDFWLFYC